MAYLHGVYGQLVGSGLTTAASVGTLPVYFGLAPIHQLADYSGKVGVPLVVTSDEMGQRIAGYSASWDKFTLSEPMYVHFRGANPVGPIVLINALDPDKHRGDSEVSKSLVWSGKVAKIATDVAILKTVTIAGKTVGTDFSVAYDSEGKNLIITDLTDGGIGVDTATYFEVDLSKVNASDVVTAIKSGIGLVYESALAVPTILAAPGWSDQKTVADALKLAAKKINGHWSAFVFDDLDVSATHTIDAAIAKKSSELRNTSEESPCWPMATDGVRYYHLSTLAAAKSQAVDAENDNIPYETASNKQIAITGLVIKDGDAYKSIRFDKTEANRLNAEGIKTAIYWGGSWRLWGPHTGAYKYGVANVPEDIFDCSVRMGQYLANSFQLRNGDKVDKPMHRAMIDTILDAEQEELDRLVNQGALLYGKISFSPDSNPDSDIMEGQFVLDAQYTTVPPGRAIIGRYRYTATGLEALKGGEENV